MTTNIEAQDDGPPRTEATPLLPDLAPREPSQPASFLSSVRLILLSSPINLLLVFLPVAVLSGALQWSPRLVFLSNVFAMMPLAFLLSFTTDHLSRRTGEAIGGFLNVTFGNIMELIIGIVALRSGEIRLIQTTMLGSILSNLLFVLGISFVAGSLELGEVKFKEKVAHTLSSFMFIITGALILPAAFDMALPNTKKNRDGVLAFSRGTAIVLLILYLQFLVYQLKTHCHHFDRPGFVNTEVDTVIGGWAIAFTILAVTIAVSFCSDFLVGSIDQVVKSFAISKTFLGLIIVPLIGNAGLGRADKWDLVLAITLGSCMQIALFVTPFLVVLGWIIGTPMSLMFQVVVIFVSVVFTAYLIMDGRSNWMKGAMLLGVYSIVAVTYSVYPDVDMKP